MNPSVSCWNAGIRWCLQSCPQPTQTQNWGARRRGRPKQRGTQRPRSTARCRQQRQSADEASVWRDGGGLSSSALNHRILLPFSLKPLLNLFDLHRTNSWNHSLCVHHSVGCICASVCWSLLLCWFSFVPIKGLDQAVFRMLQLYWKRSPELDVHNRII